MLDKIVAFREHVKEMAGDSRFVHHKWFVKWHLEIVEKIATELEHHYPDANREVVEVLVWLHDYGKVLDFDHQYEKTLSAGREKLTQLGFPAEFVDIVINCAEILDKKLEVDLHKAPIEVQIVASADGCSHMVGPFMSLWWYEHPDKPVEQLMSDNIAKLEKDWNRKIVLPEARQVFEQRYNFLREQSGDLPTKYL
jgi:hypothetical protein